MNSYNSLTLLVAWMACSGFCLGGTVVLKFTDALEDQAPVMISIDAAPGVEIDYVKEWGRAHVESALQGDDSLLEYLRDRGFRVGTLDVEFSLDDRSIIFTDNSLTEGATEAFVRLYGDWVNELRRRAIKSMLEEYSESNSEVRAELLPVFLDRSALLLEDWSSVFRIAERG